MKFVFISLLFFSASSTWAWGKRGHESVGSLAAQLIAKEIPAGSFLEKHSFDMGSYNNVPDLVWKADDVTYKKEFPQHFIDLESYKRYFKESKIEKPWNANRKEFFATFPKSEKPTGFAPWRIEEFSQKLKDVSQKLKNPDLQTKDKHKLQEEWLVTAGIMGHYVADLAQPLHVTENYDGQLTGQKGLHHWFEEDVIDDLYPTISNEVFKRAKSRFKTFLKKNKDLSAYQLALNLAENSSQAIPALLAIDKKVGRTSAAKVSAKYKELAVERLTTGVLYLATIWSQNLDWTYNGDRFYNFVVAPAYVEAP